MAGYGATLAQRVVRLPLVHCRVAGRYGRGRSGSVSPPVIAWRCEDDVVRPRRMQGMKWETAREYAEAPIQLTSHRQFHWPVGPDCTFTALAAPEECVLKAR